MNNKTPEIVNAKAKFVFEMSWEVCNKVGGIYSVITSKAAQMRKYYDNYVTIGPYFSDKAQEDFLEESPPYMYASVFAELAKLGITAHFGSWLIKGQPKVILLEFQSMFPKKNEMKTELWQFAKVDSLFSGNDFEEPMVFSWAAAQMLLELERRNLIDAPTTILHCHEWLTGFALIRLKMEKSKIRTVFTTHATMLGRSMCGNNMDLYGMLGKFNADDKAKELKVVDKHTAEKASANLADVFTTVSDITGREAEFILGRKPDVLVYNGLDLGNFPSIEETSIKHVTARDLIREFLTYTFFPYYHFELTRNLTFFLAARYEFENKGIDILIQALGKLNEALKNQNSERTISAFIFIAMPNSGVKLELLENKNYYRHIKNYVQSKSSDILNEIVIDFLTKDNPEKDGFLNQEFLQEMKRDVMRFRRKGGPVVCTHKLDGPESNNRVIQAFKEAGLNNDSSDKVKVILFPAYLNGNDSLLNLDLYDVIAGGHLGIFPSYYEPWGYTPLEAGALGVPSVTTDLAGFGRFIKQKVDEITDDAKGIYIIRRDGVSKQQSMQELFDVMMKFALMDHAERVENKIRAKELSHLADWNHFVKRYIEAHNLAIAKK